MDNIYQIIVTFPNLDPELRLWTLKLSVEATSICTW